MSGALDLERLYDEHAQRLYAYLLNFTRDEFDTRDILQDTFVKLAREPKLLASARDERAFLIRVAHNCAIDFMRRRTSRSRRQDALAAEQVELFARTDDPDTTAFRARFASALGKLPPEQREVVHLKLWEGLTFEQIAAVLEISANTAASRHRYGLDKLRELLRPIYEELKSVE
jgi:RNA polymerase sigma-70 factor, ECF subfamily